MVPEKDLMDEELDEMSIIDLEGVKYEVIDTVSLDGHLYIAIVPLDEENDDENENIEFTILEIVDDPENDENCVLKTVDDDELYQRIGDAFLEHLDLDDDEE